MRYTILLILVFLTTNLFASGPPTRSWEPSWKMRLFAGECSLSKGRRTHLISSLDGPLYDDFWLQISVPLVWHDRLGNVLTKEIGKPRISIYTDRPQRDYDGDALQIDRAVLSGRELTLRSDDVAKNLGSSHRILLMTLEDSSAMLSDLVEARPGSHIDLQLTLSNQQKVSLRVAVGRYFKTWYKMLNVCMHSDASHKSM